MNNNKGYQDCKPCEPISNFSKYQPQHPKPQKILLECGERTGCITFTSSDDPPFQLAHVTVDTTCLNRSEVLIKFSSLVRIETVNSAIRETVRLQYELFRTCDGEKPISLGIWTFEKVNVNPLFFENIEESFSFIFCESLNCCGCCEYFLSVTPIEIINAKAIVNNGMIAALSQSLFDSSNKYDFFEPKGKDIKFNQKHPKPKEVLLGCGQGNGSIIFRDQTDPSTNIAHVTIDTTCLSRPEVLIDFSSTIKFDVGIFDLVLKFELFRICDDGIPTSRGIWKFERTGVAPLIGLDEAFSFIFCESLTCPGCCEYFVAVTVLDISTSQSSNSFVLVDNGRMAALAQSTQDCCCHDNYESSDEKCDCMNCQPKHPKPKKILLECGEGTGSKTFTPSSGETPFQLAHVTIDTTCLCKPVVNIEFSSIVSLELLTSSGGFGRLQYELFRSCDNRAPISLGVWSIGRRDFSGPDIDRATNTFGFNFCDCITCPGCCEYFVTVTPVSISGEGYTVTVSNGIIAALASEG